MGETGHYYFALTRMKVYGVVACSGCCVAVCNITASYAKRAPGQQPSALRVRIKNRYVLRPAGKHRHKVNVHHLR